MSPVVCGLLAEYGLVGIPIGLFGADRQTGGPKLTDWHFLPPCTSQGLTGAPRSLTWPFCLPATPQGDDREIGPREAFIPWRRYEIIFCLSATFHLIQIPVQVFKCSGRQVRFSLSLTGLSERLLRPYQNTGEIAVLQPPGNMDARGSQSDTRLGSSLLLLLEKINRA